MKLDTHKHLWLLMQRISMRMFVTGSLVRRVYMVVCAVLSGVSMAVHLAIPFMNVRVLMLMKVFVRVDVSMRMRVPYHSVAMLVVMVMTMLVRMDMPVFVIPVHLSSITPLKISSGTKVM